MIPVPIFIVGLGVGILIGYLFGKNSTKEKLKKEEEEEPQIEEVKVEVGQVWQDRDWEDTIFRIIKLHPTKPLFRAQYLQIDGEPYEPDSEHSDTDGTIDRWFFKNYKLLKDAEES